MLVEIAARACEIRRRGPPGVGFRGVAEEVVRDGIAGPEPDLDARGEPLHGVYAAPFGVQRGTYGVGKFVSRERLWACGGGKGEERGKERDIPIDAAEGSSTLHPWFGVCPGALM